MWGFVLIAGTVGWLSLFQIIRTDSRPVPDLAEYALKTGLGERIGSYRGWTSRAGQGRRKWCGEVLSGLPTKDRRAALLVLREQALYVRWLAGEESTWRHCCRLLRWHSPACYFLDVPDTVRARMLAPVAWERRTLGTVSFDEWARAMHRWYSQ